MNYQSMLVKARDFGLKVNELVLDGEIHRTATVSKPRSQNGWYVGYQSPLVLIVGDWQIGCQETFRGDGALLSEAELARIRKQQETAKMERQTIQAEDQLITAKKAKTLYDSADDCTWHPYLELKHIPSIEGLKLVEDQLLVPLRDLSSKEMTLVNLQRIYVSGDKRFLSGGKVSGCCFPIGLNGFDGAGDIAIAEGMATAISVNHLTCSPVLAAMNASNLVQVAFLAQRRWPNARFIVTADDDYLTELKLGDNPGQRLAKQAAGLVGGQVSTPPFTDEQRLAGLTDWNDYCSAVEVAR